MNRICNTFHNVYSPKQKDSTSDSKNQTDQYLHRLQQEVPMLLAQSREQCRRQISRMVLSHGIILSSNMPSSDILISTLLLIHQIQISIHILNKLNKQVTTTPSSIRSILMIYPPGSKIHCPLNMPTLLQHHIPSLILQRHGGARHPQPPWSKPHHSPARHNPPNPRTFPSISKMTSPTTPPSTPPAHSRAS
jgi:hypothetical protein